MQQPGLRNISFWWPIVSIALAPISAALDYNWNNYSDKVQNIEVSISPQFQVSIKQGTTLRLVIQYSPEERIPSASSELESPAPTGLPPYTTPPELANMSFTWLTEAGFLRSSDGFFSLRPGECT